MSRKRRVFDVTLPQDDAAVPAGTGPLETKSMAPRRRGPMASAIGETADTLRERQEAEAQVRAENDALAHEFVRLKKEGLIVDQVPVDKIRTSRLIRDRHSGVDPELEDLKRSLMEIGLSNPIQVEKTADGFELIQGYRRLSAYRALLEETGDTRWSHIPAGLIAQGAALEDLYRRMVDENLVRKDISFSEMAMLARAYADDPETGAGGVDEAITALYGSAGRQKRSYIRHFATLMSRLEKVLEHPYAIPRALGLAVAKRLDAEPGSQPDLVRALGPMRREEAVELEVLRSYASGGAPKVSPRGQSGRGVVAAKTSFRFQRPEGAAKCTAANGRVELRLARDFSAVDRDRLEAAVRAFFEQLDGDA